jgi:hypothetical protein
MPFFIMKMITWVVYRLGFLRAGGMPLVFVSLAWLCVRILGSSYNSKEEHL